MNAKIASGMMQSPEGLRLQLSIQLRNYLRNPAVMTAQQIVHTLETILIHPDNQDDAEQRCSYIKLLWQWKVLC